MKLLSNLLVLSSLVVLSACSMSVRSDVSRFHALPAPTGESVAIIPMSLSQKGDGLEFNQYADQVRKQLVMLGYSTADKDNADLIVELGYGAKRERGYRHDPFSASHGWFDPWYGRGYYNWYRWRRHAFFSPYYYDPFYGPFNRHLNNRPLFTRNLKLDIRENSGEKIFEGRVESLGRTRNMPKLIPLMIEAMFVDFPGESGTVKQIVVREEEIQ